MQLKRVAEAKLPTPWGDFLMVGFEELATGQDHVALVLAIFRGRSRFWLAYIQSV
jgi:GTP cyclohydrolase II